MPFGQHKADFEEGDPEYQLSQGSLDVRRQLEGQASEQKRLAAEDLSVSNALFLLLFPAYAWQQKTSHTLKFRLWAHCTQSCLQAQTPNVVHNQPGILTLDTCSSYASPSHVILSVCPRAPRLHSCTAWVYFSGALEVSLCGLGQTGCQRPWW